MSKLISKVVASPAGLSASEFNTELLPTKIEAARRAISECSNLPELWAYLEQAEMLAATVRTMRDIAPEIVRGVNALVVDAWRMGGKLLLAISSRPVPRTDGRSGCGKSPRSIASEAAGITSYQVSAMIRIAQADHDELMALAGRSLSLSKVSRNLLTAPPSTRGPVRFSRALLHVLGSKHTFGSNHRGLNEAARNLRSINVKEIGRLRDFERSIVRKRVLECQKILDKIDGRCYGSH